MKREELVQAFLDGRRIMFRGPFQKWDGSTRCDFEGVITSLEREDGSGYNFNVTLVGSHVPFFFRCERPGNEVFCVIREFQAPDGEVTWAEPLRVGKGSFYGCQKWLASYLELSAPPSLRQVFDDPYEAHKADEKVIIYISTMSE